MIDVRIILIERLVILMNSKLNKKIILKYILFSIVIIESLFIVYFASKTNERIDKLEEKNKIIEQENLDLRNENNYLLNENERLGMVNSEVWELFLADHYVKEGEPYCE